MAKNFSDCNKNHSALVAVEMFRNTQSNIDVFISFTFNSDLPEIPPHIEQLKIPMFAALGDIWKFTLC
jgi:hypothetical protein